MYANYMLLFYDLFLIICRSMEFVMSTYVDLCISPNMSWHSGCVGHYEWRVMSSNLGSRT